MESTWKECCGQQGEEASSWNQLLRSDDLLRNILWCLHGIGVISCGYDMLFHDVRKWCHSWRKLPAWTPNCHKSARTLPFRESAKTNQQRFLEFNLFKKNCMIVNTCDGFEFWSNNIATIANFLFPFLLQFPSLFSPYDISKCDGRYQWYKRATLQGF